MMDRSARTCRLCLFQGTECKDRPMIYLFQKFEYEDVAEKIQKCLNIKLSPNDTIPPIICQLCMEKVNYFSDFLELCSKSEKQLESVYGLDQCYSNTSQDSDQITHSVTRISDERVQTACKTESDFSINYKPVKKQRNQFFDLSRKKSVTIQRGKSSAMLITRTKKTKEKRKEFRILKSSSNFKCLLCKEKFASIDDYRHHTKLVHEGETIYKCGTCEKMFLDKEKCLEHEKNHKVQCQICNIKVLAKNMGMHLHKHAEKFRTKPSIIFKSPGKTPNKKIICKICHKLFKSENQLKAHMKKMHETRKIRFSANKKHRSNTLKFKSRLKRLLKAQSYKCRACHQQFSSLKELKEHMTNHKGIKKKCPKCKKEFIYKTYFNKHVLQCFYTPSTLKRTLSLP